MKSLTLIPIGGYIVYIYIYVRVRDERIIIAQGRVIGRGLLVTCGLLLASAARRSEWAFPIQLDLLNLFIYVKTRGEGIFVACL